MFCTHCGKSIPNDARFRENCGARVGSAPTAANLENRLPFVQPVQPAQEEIVLANSKCQFAKGAGIFASRGNAAVTNKRIIYYKHGVAKTLLLGHAVHLTKGDYDMEISYENIDSMYWNRQGLSRYIGFRLTNGEHHRIYFFDFDECKDAIMRAVPHKPIPQGK